MTKFAMRVLNGVGCDDAEVGIDFVLQQIPKLSEGNVEAIVHEVNEHKSTAKRKYNKLLANGYTVVGGKHISKVYKKGVFIRDVKTAYLRFRLPIDYALLMYTRSPAYNKEIAEMLTFILIVEDAAGVSDLIDRR